MRNAPDISDQDAIRLGVGDELEKTFLAGFLNARGCQKNGGVGILPNHGHGILIAAYVFVIDEDFSNALRKGGLQLLFGADEHTEHGGIVHCGAGQRQNIMK